MSELKAKLRTVPTTDQGNMDSLKKSLAELEKDKDEVEKKVQDLEKEEKVREFHCMFLLCIYHVQKSKRSAHGTWTPSRRTASARPW